MSRGKIAMAELPLESQGAGTAPPGNMPLSDAPPVSTAGGGASVGNGASAGMQPDTTQNNPDHQNSQNGSANNQPPRSGGEANGHQNDPSSDITDASPRMQSDDGPILIRDRYFIDTDTPLPHLDQPSAHAFKVEDRNDLNSKLFALIATPGLPTRTDVMRFLKNEDVAGLLPLVDWGTIFWPLFGKRTIAVIYEEPLGGRAMDRILSKTAKITEYDIPKKVIQPLMKAITALSRAKLSHHAIRPQNIFFMDEEFEHLVLGDCVTSPPGYDQPVLFEPLERAFADKAGRGTGTERDDIYSLGATVVELILGYNPLSEAKKNDLLVARLEQGSYASLCGQARIPMSLLEPLRGMLNDSPSERWNSEDINTWLDGKKMTPLQKKIPQKAETPFTFMGASYLSPDILAWNFSFHPKEASEVIKSDEFMQWLKRGLGNDAMATALRSVVQNVNFHKDDAQGSNDYLICRASMVLSPFAPVRYKGLTFMPDGFGPEAAMAYLQTGDTLAATEVITLDIILFWLDAQTTRFPGTLDLKKNFGQLKGFLNIKDPGYGLPRVLYEISPGMPCLSPLVLNSGVVDIEDLLPALDEASKYVDNKQKPIDEHIVAFIATRFQQDIHPHLKALASPIDATSLIGMLSLLAFLQWKLKTPAVFGLASWVGGMLGPAIETYNNRFTREDIEKEIPRLVRKGSLPEIFDLIDNAEKRKEDVSGYEEAKLEFAMAEYEIRDIEGAGSERTTKAERSGQQTASMISVVLALILITVLTIYKVF